jgi:hypothetical protein
VKAKNNMCSRGQCKKVYEKWREFCFCEKVFFGELLRCFIPLFVVIIIIIIIMVGGGVRG